MGGPWEDYQDGPWKEYAQAAPSAPQDQSGSVTLSPMGQDPNYDVANRSTTANPGYVRADAIPLMQDPAMTGAPVYSGLTGQDKFSGLNVPNAFEEVARSAGPAIGGTIGAVAGPLGSMAGAAAGRSVQNAIQNTASVFDPNVQQKGVKTLIAEPAIEAATQGVFAGAGALATKAKPLAVKLGAQVLRAGPGIPEKYGAAALNDLGMLSRSKSKAEISAAYEAFEKANGLVSPRNARASAGNLVQTAQDAMTRVNAAFQKITTKQPITAQEAYEASQAARFLKDQAKFGNPDQLANLSNIQQAKTAIDDTLEALAPGYRELRGDAFEQKAADQFSSILPLNKNQSPNVLRTWTTGAAAAGGLAAGSPAALALPLAISPAVAGAGIRGANYAAKAGRAALSTNLPQAYTAQSLEDLYRRMGVQP